MNQLGRYTLWLATALSEAVLAQAWAAVVLAVLGPSDWLRAMPSLPALTLLYIAAAYITMRWGPQHTDPEWRSWLHTGLGAAVIAGMYVAGHYAWGLQFAGLLGRGPGLATLFAAWYIWVQGAATGARGLAFSGMSAGFPVRGTFMVLAAFAGAWFLRFGYAPPHLWPILYRSVIAYFAATLTGLALARLWQVRLWQVSVGEEEEPERVSPALVGLSLAIVGGSVLLEALGPGGALEPIGRAISSAATVAGRWLEPTLEALLMPLLKALGLFVTWVRGLRRPPDPEETGAEDLAGPDAPPPLRTLEVNKELLFTIVAIAVLVLTFVIMLMVMKAIRRGRGGRTELLAGNEERESLGLLHGLKNDLRSLWLALVAWIRRVLGRVVPAVSAEQAAADAEWAGAPPPVRDIRSAFRRLQQVGARRGRPRRAAETPLHYGRALGENLPAAGAPAGVLAELYSRVRYGRLEPGAADVQAAREAVEQVEAAHRAAEGAERRGG